MRADLWSFVDQSYSRCSASFKLFIMGLYEANKSKCLAALTEL